MAAAHKDRDPITKGADMCCLPAGPYETEEQLVEAVHGWAAHTATHGGAFATPPKQESLKQNIKKGITLWTYHLCHDYLKLQTEGRSK
jgi:hypothetical protein